MPHDEDFRKAAARLSRRVLTKPEITKVQEEKEEKKVSEITEDLQRESHFNSYQAVTIRIDPQIFDSMNDFCDTNNIKRSVLLRRVISLGWEEVLKARGEQSG